MYVLLSTSLSWAVSPDGPMPVPAPIRHKNGKASNDCIAEMLMTTAAPGACLGLRLPPRTLTFMQASMGR